MRIALPAIVLVALSCAGPVRAQTPDLPPVPSFGESCPASWRAGNGQCWPGPGARPVIRRAGADCPSGWQATVGWCQRGLRAADARVRTPSGCPAGWREAGAYCREE